MKKFLTLSALLFLITASTVAAQAHSEDEVLNYITNSTPTSPAPGVALQQMGTGNEAYIQQVTQGASGIDVIQSGRENEIILMQTGDYIHIRVSQQGSGNLYDADIEGTDSRIDISQSGAENSIMQSLMVNGAGISIMQRGQGNEVIHTGTSTNSGIQVQQQGAGMKVIIQTN